MDTLTLIKNLQQPNHPVDVVLDTDAYNEIDDQFALIYSLFSPEQIRLAGVTAAPFENSRSENYADGMEKSFQEICRILEITGKSGEVPAFRGSTSRLPDRNTPVNSAAADFNKLIISSSVNLTKNLRQFCNES